MAILIFGFIIRSAALFRAVRGDEGSFLYLGWMIVKGRVLYRNFFNDEIRAVEVKIVFEWILKNYALEKTFGSGIEEIYIYHSQFW